MEILVFLIVLGILVVIELVYYKKHALDDLDLDVSFSKKVANCGEIVEVIEVAKNNKRLPLPFLILKFETPLELEFQDMTNTTISDLLYRLDMLTMKPFSKHTRKIKAKCTKRGFYSFNRVNISTSDLLLFETMTKEFPNNACLTVLPERLDNSEIATLLSLTLSEIQIRRTLLTDPFAFAGIRDYQPWDPMKSINWTASAKTGNFMVNTNASTSAEKVTIFLNLEIYNTKRSTSLLEKSISLAYTYMCELSKNGIMCAIYTNGTDGVTKNPIILGADANREDDIRRGTELSRIDLKTDALSFPILVDDYISNTSTDDFIVVISPKFDGSFTDTMKSLKSKRKSALWIMPAYKTTPQLTAEQSIGKDYIRWEVKGHD